MSALLTLDRVSKRYGALTVVDAVSFSVAPGEALGVIGPNGAGKSTIFNLITGDVPADSGRITFEGAAIGSLPPHARCQAGIGRTYQIPHPFAKMTVFENLLVGAAFGARRGEHLPVAYYAPPHIVHDYHAYHLDRPPHGHHWVRVGRDAVLAAITTGIVLDTLHNHF